MSAFHAIIPAGGAGTRLWPLSRRAHPKFLLDLTGAGRSMLQATVARLTPISDSITVVTGAAHESAVAEQVPQLGRQAIVGEPSPRNSMAAIGLAAGLVARRVSADAVVGTFAADHVITDVAAFHRAVRRASALADQGWLVTLGVAPTRPATGFGYIHRGAPIESAEDTGAEREGRADAFRARSFIEKPDAEHAAHYLAGGEHLWNAGMFIARADVLLDQLAQQRPAMAQHLSAIADAWDNGAAARSHALSKHWRQLESIAIDHAIAEPAAEAGGVAVVPVEMGWDDIGDAAAVAKHVPAQDGVRVIGERHRVHAVDSPGTLAATDTRDIVVVGIPDAIVLDTPDGLLVTTRAQAHEVGSVPALLADRGRHEVL